MKIGLRAKFGLFFLGFGFVMLSAISVLIYKYTLKEFMNHYTDSISKVVSATAYSLDLSPEEISRYAQTGVEDEHYWDILKKIKHVQEKSGFVYVYLIYPIDEESAVWVFYTSSETGDVEPPGAPIMDYNTQKYETVREIYLTGEKDDVLDLPETDAGLMLSVYHPLNDNNGNTIAILGGDVSLDDILDLFLDSLLEILPEMLVLMIVGMVLLLLFVQVVVIRSIRRLQQGVQKMADGEMGVQVASKRRDEIGDITSIFNRMSLKIHRHMDEIQELNYAYQKFIPPESFEILRKKSVVEMKLGDQEETKLTVLFMQPKDFKTAFRNMSSEEIFCYINRILAKTVPAVLGEGGVIERFEKAGLCSFYRNHAQYALKSAVLACESLKEEKEMLCAGIAAGTVMVGIVGQDARMDIISISEQTRLSEFLMEIAPKYHASILISQSAAAQIGDLEQTYHYRFIGYLKIAAYGKTEGVYDVFDGDRAEDRRYKQMTKDFFEQGVRLYCSGNYNEARQAFIEVLKRYRKDEAAKIYLTRCSQYLQKEEKAGDIWIEVL